MDNVYRVSPLKKAIAIATSAMLATTLGIGSVAQAYAVQGGSGSTEVKLILKSQLDDVSNALRDKDGNVIIGTNPLTVVIPNEGEDIPTGSVYVWDDDANDGEGGYVDTGIDVFIDDDGVPYTDEDGVVWPKESVVTDFTGNPILDENNHITVRQPVGELTDPIKTYTDSETGNVYVVISESPLRIIVDNGDGTASIYEDSNGDGEIDFESEATGEKVFVYTDPNPDSETGILPYTDRNDKIWVTTDVKVDKDNKPILDIDDETGKAYIIPIRNVDDPTGNPVGKRTDVTIIGYTDDGKQITVDHEGNVYYDGEDTGKDVDVDINGKPLTDAEGNVYLKEDVLRDENDNPILDDNGNVIPTDTAVPIGNIGATDSSHADDNLSFTVPTVINFTSDSNGRLTGPSTEKTYIENNSKFGIHVSSMEFQKNDKFDIVDDVSLYDDSRENIVDFKIGPEGYTLNASDYLKKKAVTNQNKWSMTAGVTSNNQDDRVYLHTEGDVDNLNSTVKTNDTIGIIQWYVSTGEVH